MTDGQPGPPGAPTDLPGTLPGTPPEVPGLPSEVPGLPPEPTGSPQQPADGWVASAVQPGSDPMQVMDLGQVVDAVITLYRQRPWLLLGLCATLQVPAAILAGLILLPVPGRFGEILGFDPFDPPTTFDPTIELPTPSTDQLLGILVPIWLAALVSIVAGTLTTMAVAQAVARLRQGQATTIVSVFRAVLGRLGPALAALILYTIALLGLLLLALIAFVVPLSLAPSATAGGPLAFAAVLALAAVLVLTAFASIRWTFWPQAVILDGTGPGASLGRSWRLIAGSTWRVVGYVLLFGLAAGILQGLLAQLGLIVVDGLTAIISAELAVVLSFVVNTLATLLLAPVVPVAMTLLYLDLRIRRGERLA